MSTFTNLLYHIVFSTKHREPLIQPSFQYRTYEYIGGIVREHGDALIQIGGMADHVHLIVKLRPNHDVSEVVRLIKANSSKWLNESADYPGHFAWQTGYAAFSVSQSQLPEVKHYVEHQAEHHRYRSFQEEYVAFLDRHGIEYDAQYLWE